MSAARIEDWASFDNSDIPFLRRISVAIQRVGGINLGQGTCQLPVPQLVARAAERAIREGYNRYTLPQGLLETRVALAKKLSSFNHFDADPESEISITPGVTGAFEAVCHTLLKPGDEVISFEPYYPYHHSALKRAGAVIKYVPLFPPEWSFSIEFLKSQISPRTRFILVNTPGNPTGKVFTRGELEALGEICNEKKIWLVTDEMYEYMTFDGRTHTSAASIPELRERTITMGGYSKTFAITGWRIGYLVAPVELTFAFRRALDGQYICSPAPFQRAVGVAISELEPSFYSELLAKYQSKRDYFCSVLRKIGFELSQPQGAYYIVADYSRNFGDMDSPAFVMKMLEESKVGAVPSNDFVEKPRDHRWVRICVALEDSELEKAADQLTKLSKT